MTHYGLELIKHSLQAGHPLDAGMILYRILRGRLSGPLQLVYDFSVDQQKKPPKVVGDEYRVNLIQTIYDMQQPVMDALEGHKQGISWDYRKLFDQGAQMWVGSVNDAVTNIGWTRTGGRVEVYFFPLLNEWAVFSHFFTFPPFRGRGLYSALLAHMVQQMGVRDITRCFIDCMEWNLPSLRGIRRAGFHYLGCGRIKQTGRIIWYPNEHHPTQ